MAPDARLWPLACDALEPRLLLAAFPDYPDLKIAPLGRLGAELAGVYAEYAAHRAAGKAAGAFGAGFLPVQKGRIALEVAGANPAGLVKRLKRLGLKHAARAGYLVSGQLPIQGLPKLAALGGVRFARPAWSLTRIGSITTQGDVAERSDILRSISGLTGKGISVGIISDSFDTDTLPGSYAADIASGDLPADVNILQDFAGQSDEGRAMAQIVHDIAPEASLLFHSGMGGQADFISALNALKAAGARVIVDDLTYLAAPMFADGPIAQAVDRAVAEGIVFVTAAGNEGYNSYDSAFRPGTVYADAQIPTEGGLQFGGGVAHDFDPGSGVDSMQAFTLGVNKSISLSIQWDQPYFSANGRVGSQSDVDVYLLNADGSKVLAAANTDNMDRDPVEVLQYTNTTGRTATFNLMIVHWGDGPVPGRLKYIEFDGNAFFTQFPPRSGTIFGHANAAGALTVGAAAFHRTPAFGTSPPIVEPFSAQGAASILFDGDGNRIDPLTRPKPDIVGPDNVNNTFLGWDISNDADTLPNFPGTSAAAPHVAAVMALLLEAVPTASPAQLKAALQSTAIDMDDPETSGFDKGPDMRTGYGLIQADAALRALTTFAFDAQAGTYALRRDATGGMVEIFRGEVEGEPLYAVSATLPLPLTFVGGGGEDLLVIDVSNGMPALAGGIVFTAGNNDRLRFRGDGAGVFAYEPGGPVPIRVNGQPHGVSFSGGDRIEAENFAALAVNVDGVSGELTFDTPGSGGTRLSGSSGGVAFAPVTFFGPLTLDLANAALASLRLEGSAQVSLPAGADVALRLGSLFIAPDAQLDLADGALIVDAPPGQGAAALASLSGLIARAHAGQRPGLASLAPDAQPRPGLGVILNDRGAGRPFYRDFAGQSVGPEAVLIRRTRDGDTDLNGIIDASDYFRLARGLARGLNDYGNGDFNYDGQIDAEDYGRIDRAFLEQGRME